MVSEEVKESRGLLMVRLSWKKLQEAKTLEEMTAVLQEVAAAAGSETVHVQLELTPAMYVRIMGNAWFAFNYKEIDELSMRAYIYRSLQVEEYNLKTLHVRRNP
jgi:hypothetical protein